MDVYSTVPERAMHARWMEFREYPRSQNRRKQFSSGGTKECKFIEIKSSL